MTSRAMCPASGAPIRMAQPHSGPGYGIHFPNHAGAELVFACVDGDPDRPLALGTVPNPSQRSPSVAANRMQNVVRTYAGSELVMDDTQNAAFVRLSSPDRNAVLLDDEENRVVVSTTGRHAVTLDADVAAGRIVPGETAWACWRRRLR